MLRNISGQKWRVFAYDRTTGAPKTGDAANISAKITKDNGSPATTNDAAPTEVDSTNEPGYYEFDLTQAESDAYEVKLGTKSSTTSISVIPCPAVQNPVPQYFSLLGIASDGDLTKVNALDGLGSTLLTNLGVVFVSDFSNNYDQSNGVWLVDASRIGGTTQTGRDIGASVLLSPGTGTGQLDITSGVAKVNVTQFNGSNVTSSGGRPEVNATHWGGTAIGSANVRANVTQFAGTNLTSASGIPEVKVATHSQAALEEFISADPRLILSSTVETYSGGTGLTTQGSMGDTQADETVMVLITDVSTGAKYVRGATVLDDHGLTLDSAIAGYTPEDGVDTLRVYLVPQQLATLKTAIEVISAGSGLDEEGMRAALGMDAADLDEQLGALAATASEVKGQTDQLSFTGGNVDSNVKAVNGVPVTEVGDVGDIAGAVRTELAPELETINRLDAPTKTIVTGTVGEGSSTTAIVVASISVEPADADQLKGLVLKFPSDTDTAELAGQGTDITANTTGATPTLTVTELTHAPAAGDEFVIE